MFDQRNCTFAPRFATTDAGVAGTGVLLSFIVTAAVALMLSAVIVLHEMRRKNESKILRKVLLSFSDQQIITGIGIQCVGLAKMQTMIPYHFFIIWMLSLLSSATHLATLLALVNDFKRDWILRWIREGLMLVNLVLSSVFGVYVMMSSLRSLPSTLPIACVWEVLPEPFPSNAAISIAGTIGVIAGNFIIFGLGVWYVHSPQYRWTKFVQLAGLVVLSAIAVGATIRVIMLAQAFGQPSVPLLDDGERIWSFGQLLPLLLLLLPIMSAIEIIRGEMNIPAPVNNIERPLKNADEDGRQQLVISAPFQDERNPYQPNPFFNSQPIKR